MPKTDDIYTRFKGHDISLTRETRDANWYIRVRGPDGLHVYDGYWRDSAGKSAKDALHEAKVGAMLIPKPAQMDPAAARALGVVEVGTDHIRRVPGGAAFLRVAAATSLTRCAADRDGDCTHAQCPQLRDGEPKATGRSCPVGVPEGQTPEHCEWREDDPNGLMPGTYASACGELWSFNDGGPNENNVRFCQGCGKPVQVLAFVEPTDEDAAGVAEGAK